MTLVRSATPIVADPDPPHHIRLSEVLGALSYALDITEGQPEGHAARTCVIGMRLADILGLSGQQRSALYYALLIKDIGCSANSAVICTLFGGDDLMLKQNLLGADWRGLRNTLALSSQNIASGAPLPARLRQAAKLARIGGAEVSKQIFEARCDRGGQIALMLGFQAETADAIRTLNERWDGSGSPVGLRGEAIPLLGQIVSIAQITEIFFRTGGVRNAYAIIRDRSDRWFAPPLVAALTQLEHDRAFWQLLGGAEPQSLVGGLEPEDHVLTADQAQLDRVAEAFAQVIDAKSPWTYRHSEGVAQHAVQIGQRLALDAVALRDLRRAALLHDIGKLGVSNTILDKAGPLTPTERAAMQAHTQYTFHLLDQVSVFRHLAPAAAAHHERLDGSGYHRGLSAESLPQAARILAVADVYDALTADRPYRSGMTQDAAFAILDREAGSKLDPACVAALRASL